MWMVVGMANSQKQANHIQKALEAEGILVKLRNISNKTKMNGNVFEVMVLESESDLAREIMMENGL